MCSVRFKVFLHAISWKRIVNSYLSDSLDSDSSLRLGLLHKGQLLELLLQLDLGDGFVLKLGLF